MEARTYLRASACAGLLVAALAGAPGTAAAADPPTCTYAGQDGTPRDITIGAPESVVVRCEAPASSPDDYPTVDITSVPSKGSVNTTASGPGYVEQYYQANNEGLDEFTFTATSNGATTQTYTVRVNNVNTPPTCEFEDTFYVSTDDPANPYAPVGNDLAVGKSYYPYLFCSDAQNEPITLSFTQAPTHGTGTFLREQNGPPLLYTPFSNGAETFSVRAFDGKSYSAPLTFTATVTGGPEAPAQSGGANTPAAPPSVLPAPTPAKPVTQAPAPAPAAKFSLGKVPSSVTVDSKGSASIPVTGTPGSKGSVSITAEAPKSASAAALAKKKAKKAKALSLGSKGFTLPASGSTKVKVKVGGKGLKALKKAKKLSAKVTVKTDKASVTKKFTLKAPKAKSKKRK